MPRRQGCGGQRAEGCYHRDQEAAAAKGRERGQIPQERLCPSEQQWAAHRHTRAGICNARAARTADAQDPLIGLQGALTPLAELQSKPLTNW